MSGRAAPGARARQRSRGNPPAGRHAPRGALGTALSTGREALGTATRSAGASGFRPPPPSAEAVSQKPREGRFQSRPHGKPVWGQGPLKVPGAARPGASGDAAPSPSRLPVAGPPRAARPSRCVRKRVRTRTRPVSHGEKGARGRLPAPGCPLTRPLLGRLSVPPAHSARPLPGACCDPGSPSCPQPDCHPWPSPPLRGVSAGPGRPRPRSLGAACGVSPLPSPVTRGH